MKRVVIESPLSPSNGRTFAENIEYARRCCLDSLSRGEACYASHLFFTQFQDDVIHDQRRRGMEAGFAWGQAADLCAVYTDFGISEGMKEGAAKAERRGCKVEYRTIGREAEGHVKIHLTASEIERVVALAEATEGVDRAALVVFLLRALPIFKAAAGFPVCLDSHQWAKLAGGRRYPVLRLASGLFVQRGNYNPHTATSKTWACSFAFDAVAPARAEFGAPRTKSDAAIYRAAVLTALRVRRVEGMSGACA